MRIELSNALHKICVRLPPETRVRDCTQAVLNMKLHFSLILVLTAYAGPLPANAGERRLTAQTEALLQTRLIFVYDDEGCRELEGLGFGMQMPAHYPMHRAMMLGELERRLNEDISSRYTLTGASAELPKYVKPVSVRSTYLESLEMEIAQVPDGMSLKQLESLSVGLPCVKYVSRDDVKFVEKEQSYPPANEPSQRIRENDPMDPLFRYQWGLKGGEGVYGVDAEGVWRDGNWHGSSNMTIAIIDSGCNIEHPDMVGQYWKNEGETDCNDGIDNDGNGFIDDCNGWDFVDEDNSPQATGTSHGTAAAGIIGAKSNNGAGISGICWNCRLMCLRFISNTEGTVANEVRAIDYAVKMGAKISNNSYGGYANQ